MARRGRGPAAADDEHAAVVAAVRMLLPQTDMSTTTERDVREMVQRELRLESVEQHKAVIKAEVDAFLTSVVERQQPQPQHNDSGGNARKRAPSHQAAPGAPRAKNARRKSHEDEDGDEDSDDDVDDGDGSDDEAPRAELPAGAHALDAAGLKLVRLSDFKGRRGVDVRTFFRVRCCCSLPTSARTCSNVK
jgi:DEK C terminal domain